MPDINSTSAADSFSQFQINSDTAQKNNELGKTQFLELMVTQLKNQDPLSPQDNSEFVAQLAQFSSVEGIENLNNLYFKKIEWDKLKIYFHPEAHKIQYIYIVFKT